MLNRACFPGWPRLRRRLFARWALVAAALLCLGASLAPRAVLAQGGAGALPLERRIKAAFLYKFLGYAEFPAASFGGPGTPIVIGVAGADDIAAELARIVAGRSVGNRPIVLRTVREGEAGGTLQLLFIGGHDCAHAGRVAQAAPGALLVVTDCDSAPPPASAINFLIVDDRVRFDVSLEAAERNNVKLSSRLLTVANHVQKGAQP